MKLLKSPGLGDEFKVKRKNKSNMELDFIVVVQ